MGGKQNLSPKEILACEGYLRGLSLRKALIAASYAPLYLDGQGHMFRWLKRRPIIEYLRKRQAAIVRASDLDIAEIIQYTRDIIRSNDPRDRTKAVELLIRISQPLPDNPTSADKASISISFVPAKKDE